MRKWSEMYFFFFFGQTGQIHFRTDAHTCMFHDTIWISTLGCKNGWLDGTNSKQWCKTFSHLVWNAQSFLFFPFLFLIPFPAFANQLLSHSITVIICCSLNAAFHCTMIDSSKWVFLDFQSKCVPAWHSTDTRSKRLFVRQVPELHRKLI